MNKNQNKIYGHFSYVPLKLLKIENKSYQNYFSGTISYKELYKFTNFLTKL